MYNSCNFTHDTPFGILILIGFVTENPRTTEFIISPKTFLSTGAKVLSEYDPVEKLVWKPIKIQKVAKWWQDG